ncbi:hypothetical protein A4X13_0g4076 [Tilletia indica]|uniref:rRNA-processing protein EBP2 n=1 Tax=Tilletia indica TaxID=43049 RepID=A0A177TXJ2_9BASI|nr:hypothetical protein A4X13_0g4076 [Tilletia indica]
MAKASKTNGKAAASKAAPVKAAAAPTKAAASKKAAPAPAPKAKAKTTPAKKTNGKAAAAPPTPANDAEDAEEDDEDEDFEDVEDSSSDEEEDGLDVSRKGMERLLAALGEDSLDEMSKAALEQLGDGADDDDDEDEEEEDDDEEEEGDDEEDEDEDEEMEGEVTLEEGNDEDEEDEDEEEDIELDALDGATASALPEEIRGMRTNRVKQNNTEALRRVLDEVRAGAASSGGADGKGKAKGKLPWIETMSIVWNKSVEEEVGEDGKDDDLRRELSFYQQALHAAVEGRKLVETAGVTFSRPSDYFAEMVKTDVHMERVRQRLLDERAGIKASEDAKRQRELKKFGKKVQVEKLLERQRSKRQMEEKIKGLKRKHSGLDEDGAGGAGKSAFAGTEDFDVRLEEAIGNNASSSDGPNKKARTSEGSTRGGARGGARGAKMPRTARDTKYGYGGKKRHAKENTAESSADLYGEAGGRGGRGGRGGGRGGARGGGRGGSGGRGGGRGAARGSFGGSSRGGGRGGARGGGNRPGKARRSDSRK